MSVQNQIDRIKTAVANSYTSVEEKGGTIPETKNIENLPEAINSIKVNWGDIGGTLSNQTDLNTALGGKSEKVVSGTLSLLSTSWVGSTSPYTQEVLITGSTSKSMINLQTNASTFSQMLLDGTTMMYVENNEGTLTVYALGNKPSVNLNVQYTKTELA